MYGIARRPAFRLMLDFCFDFPQWQTVTKNQAKKKILSTPKLLFSSGICHSHRIETRTACLFWILFHQLSEFRVHSKEPQRHKTWPSNTMERPWLQNVCEDQGLTMSPISSLCRQQWTATRLWNHYWNLIHLWSIQSGHYFSPCGFSWEEAFWSVYPPWGMAV